MDRPQSTLLWGLLMYVGVVRPILYFNQDMNTYTVQSVFHKIYQGIAELRLVRALETTVESR